MIACASNMRQIGQAFELYAHQNHDLYPWAECNYFLPSGGQAYVTWDDLLNHQLGGQLTDQEQQAPFAPRSMAVLECPADTAHRRAPSFPPATGLLYPRSYAITRVFGSDPQRGLSFLGIGGQVAGFPSGDRISVKRVWIPRPSETLLLVEKPDWTNIQGWIGTSGFADGPLHQLAAWRWPPAAFQNKSNHGGKWNYLFCDGHVTSLAVQETVRFNGSWYASISAVPANYLWTRNPND